MIAAVVATGRMVIEPVAVSGGPQDVQGFAIESTEKVVAASKERREELKQHEGGGLLGATLEL